MYNILNSVGNLLTFSAQIEIRPTPPTSPFQPNYPVWEGSMKYATFDSLEDFVSLVAESYGGVSASLLLSAGGAGDTVTWQQGDGYLYGSASGAAAVEAAAASLKARIAAAKDDEE